MDTQDIIRNIDNGCLTLEFNRPGKKNALTSDMYSCLADSILEAESDESIRVVYFKGQEDCFTAGNDISDFAKCPPLQENSPVIRFLKALVTCTKVMVTSVSGPAVGIGTTLLLHCDLNYCTDATRFQLPFINLGLCPEGGSSLLLPRIAGYHKAAELLLLGEPFGASDALEIGLVNQVLPTTELFSFTEHKIQTLLKKPAQALKVSKKLLSIPFRNSLPETIDIECQEFAKCLQSSEAQEIFKNFLNN